MTQIIAHRGVSSLAPENTMPAFAKAIEIGADGIELDVHLSRDGKLMVIHDEKLARTTGQAGMVGDYDAQELRRFSAHARMDEFRGVQIPYLEEVLELLRPSRLTLNIELKTNLFVYPGIEEKVLKAVKDSGMIDRVYYSSFNHMTLHRVKCLDPERETGLLYEEDLVRPWDYARMIAGADALHPYHITIREDDYMDSCRAAGVVVRPWTVDDPEVIRKMLRIGVDAVITNVPHNALPIREAFEKESK